MIIVGPVAIARNGVIGSDNDLPWYLPEDLKHFKAVTLGKTVLMGRKTYESIVKRLGKPLPQRKNVVITRQIDYQVPEGVLIFHNLDDALNTLKNEDIYLIGGAEIFKYGLAVADKLYLTHVNGEYQGDVYFPEYDKTKWHEASREDKDGFSWVEYNRKPSPQSSPFEKGEEEKVRDNKLYEN